MRRALLLPFVVAILLTALLAQAGGVPCDLTGDGQVDASDVRTLEAAIGGKAECPEGVRCDVDGDRHVAEADLELLRLVVAGEDVCPADGPLCPEPKRLETTIEQCVAVHADLAEDLRLEAKNELSVMCEEHCRAVAGCHLRLRETHATGPFWSRRTGKCSHNMPSFGQTWFTTCRCTRR
jgi:hypothetical protein